MQCLDRIRSFPGRVGFYYHPIGQEAVGFQEDLPMHAASVIKLPIMAAAFRLRMAGELDFDKHIAIRPEDKMPSCGALGYMHDGLDVTVGDLVVLMIILSDNTAANLMIDQIGMARINQIMSELGIPGVSLRRKLFDAEMSAKGIENTVTARGIGMMLDRIAQGTLLGGRMDEEMLSILLNQRLNGKIPFFLHDRGVRAAHKTGEDDGITHDVGIIFGKKPFVLCMLSNQVNVPAFERLIQDTALELYEAGEIS